MMLRFPEMIKEIVCRNLLDQIEDANLKSIALMAVEKMSAHQGAVGDWVSDIADPRYRGLIARIAMSDEHWDRQGCERLLIQFEARSDRRTKENLQRRIMDAEKSNDMDLLCRLLREKQKQAAKGMTN